MILSCSMAILISSLEGTVLIATQTSFDQIKNSILSIKKNADNIITNYLSQDFTSNEICIFENENGLLFLVRDKEYKLYRMYYVVDSLDTLENLLKQMDWQENISMEIVTQNKLDDNLIFLFKKYGICKYDILRKMSSLSDVIFKAQEEIDYYSMTDIESLVKIFDEKFDKYSEKLPSICFYRSFR